MSKKQVVLSLSFLVLGLFMVFVLVTPAVYGEEALVIIDRQGCFVPDMAGDIYQVDGRGTIVWTNNNRDTVNVACSGELPESAELPDRATKFRSTEVPGHCYVATDETFTDFVFTDDWSINLTPGGQAQLICKIH